MRPLFLVFLGLVVLAGTGSGVWAASDQAQELRQANNLVEYQPPQEFLATNFIAEEMDPDVIFGPVKEFVATRQCPTTWLIGERDEKRPGGSGGKDTPEYTLYLEEDCPDQVTYYVFLDQSGYTPEQWMKWRQRFHGSKAEPTYGPTYVNLEKACKVDCGVGGELRFIQVNGELMTKSPEKVLLEDLKISPIYDLKQGKKLSP